MNIVGKVIIKINVLTKNSIGISQTFVNDLKIDVVAAVAGGEDEYYNK